MKDNIEQARIMLCVALVEVCQLRDRPHLIDCRATDEKTVNACVLLPQRNWPPIKVCEDSGVLHFLALHHDLLVALSVLDYLIASGQFSRRDKLDRMLAARKYTAAIRYSREILDSLHEALRDEVETKVSISEFYMRPAIRVTLEIETGVVSRASLSSILESQLTSIQPLEFPRTSSVVENIDEIREVTLVHLAQIRPYAIRYLRRSGIAWLRRQEQDMRNPPL